MVVYKLALYTNNGWVTILNTDKAQACYLWVKWGATEGLSTICTVLTTI